MPLIILGIAALTSLSHHILSYITFLSRNDVFNKTFGWKILLETEIKKLNNLVDRELFTSLGDKARIFMLA